MSRLPVVAIVGRPNVGKSTLFNRLLGRRAAIVADRPGVTVDRIEQICALDDERRCVLVDTGGVVEPGRAELQPWIERQAEAAIKGADLVVFVVDAQDGVTPADEALADRLRRDGRPLLLVANKAENPDLAYAFHALGLGDPLPVSALHGHGMRRLRAAIAERLPAASATGATDPDEGIAARIAVIGRPNAGKSTLINAWLGQARLIESPVAGATRDAIDVDLACGDTIVRLIDTAGLRRRSRVRDEVEGIARIKAIQALARADAAVLLLDGADEDGVAEQDVRLARLAFEEGCALVLAVNKIDAIDAAARRRFDERLRFRFRAFGDAPLCAVSARTGRGLRRLLTTAIEAARRNRAELTTGALNRWLQMAQRRQPPPSDDGAPVKLKYAVQIGTRPPTIRVFANRPDAVRASYRRYLEHTLREAFDLAGVPVRFRFDATENPYAPARRRR